MEAQRRRMMVANVLGQNLNKGNFMELFTLGKKLGQGQFGTTYICEEKATKQQFAVKVISKEKLLQPSDVDDVRREVAILHHVSDQPNIVQIKGAYEDRFQVYIVMEVCTGGELYDAIIQRIEEHGVPYSERDAAELAQVIVRVVEECHSLGVIHRDLKPENFLLSSPERNAELKVTDFGLSDYFSHSAGLLRHCGSPMYMAPEVVLCRPGAWSPARKPLPYDKEVDIWSAGVIIYALLCGFPPFYHRSNSSVEIFKAILRGNLNFTSEPWPHISDDAKDLLKKMLSQDPRKRPTASEVLRHPWFQNVIGETLPPLPSLVVERMKHFTSMLKLQKIAAQVIATRLSEEEIAAMRELFRMMDVDRSGTITLTELREGLLRMGAHMTEEEITRIMEEADVDHSGQIEYGEFLAATVQISKIQRGENLMRAFRFFDRDNSGGISMEELYDACKQLNFSHEEVEEMMEEVDSNHDGTIDYQEFVSMMLAKTGGNANANTAGQEWHNESAHTELADLMQNTNLHS